MSFWQSQILAIVEGLTEYLPVSSTGHIILTSWVMGVNNDEFVKNYTVMVQFGAIFAVVVMYWRRFILNFRLYPKVMVGVLPAVVVGLSVKKKIDYLLGSVWVVGLALLVGGILLVLTDRWLKRMKPTIHDMNSISFGQALKVGVAQLLAFIPGVSRSAASIWGGLYQGMDLSVATEFSFFLALPTLTGATLLKGYAAWPHFTSEQVQMLIYGNLASFVVGILAIRGFIGLLEEYGLKGFGYYRIILGAIVLVAAGMGHDLPV
jgi:undecaprenyl-diphosphatase